MFVVNRIGDANAVYRNGSSLVSTSNAAQGRPTHAFYIGAQNNAGTPNLPSARQYAFGFAGAAMNATQQANFYTAIQAFMNAIGAGVSAAPPMEEMPTVVFEELTAAGDLGAVLLAQQGINPTGNFGAHVGL
jgi:hypothetical protein